jgi:glycogen operon protein
LLSQGTPMLLAGDEFKRSQQGNNNAYCQDNAISWVDWDQAEASRSLIDFVRRILEIRRQYPVLRRGRFLTGERNEDLDVKDVTWVNANGNELEQGAWEDGNMRCFGMILDGRAQATGIRRRASDATMLVFLNAHYDLVNVILPTVTGGRAWTRLVDTNAPDLPSDSCDFGSEYQMTEQSLLLFVMESLSA